MPSKRLFVDNIPNNATEKELESEFNRFGTVSLVEIKNRKNSENDTRFAYVHLDLTSNNLHDCLQWFSNKKWKESWLAVQEAKESFLDRLKREREEATLKSNLPNVPASEPNDVTVSPKVNKKKRFNSFTEDASASEEHDITTTVKLNKKKKFDEDAASVVSQAKSTDKMHLFERDEDVDYSEDFRLREEYSTGSGQKMMELKRKLKGNTRFVIDSHFDDESEEEQEGSTVKQQPFSKFDNLEDKKLAPPAYKMMVRFDPTAPEHCQKYEIKHEKKIGTKANESKEKRKSNQVLQTDEVEKQTVSKEVFYKVNTDFQQNGDGGDFNLTSLFDNQLENLEELPEKSTNQFFHNEHTNKKLKDNQHKTHTGNLTEHTVQPSQMQKNVVSTPEFVESFFFKENDYRFEEGINFIRRLAETSHDFGAVRRELKEIVKTKVKNAKRKNKPFRKKLGGKKRIKMKKALKK